MGWNKWRSHLTGTPLPKDSDPDQVQTEDLAELRRSLDAYIDLVVSFVEANEARTRLKLEQR
jgi:hypothetical protein